MSAAEFLFLAVASIFWPLLFTIVLLVLRTTRPVPLLGSFLAGGLLACIAIGLALVFFLDGTHVLTHHERTIDPIVYVAAGMLSIAVGIHVRRTVAPPSHRRERRPSRFAPERLVTSAKLAFAAGIVLDLVPGVFPLVAMKSIAEADYGVTANVVLVSVFYVIMFASVEAPLVGYLFAPGPTVRGVSRWNAWLDRNARRIVADVLLVAGAALVLRGLIAYA